MNYQEYKNKLGEFIRYRSVSTDPQFKEQVEETVNWLTELFEKKGFAVETWQGPSTNPVVFASFETDPEAETVLIYGHYDVQPAEKEDGWTDEPFTLVEKEGKLIARGVVDNKGQILIHMHTIFHLIKEDDLKYNIKFLIEGDEETGNADLAELLVENKDYLNTDYILISDGETANYKPTIEASLRGVFNCKLKYKTADTNLHSGLYGGAHPSAAHELSKFISKLHNENHEVTIPGFYEDVEEITEDQIENNKKLYDSEDEVLKNTGGKRLTTEAGLDYYTQVGLRPSLEVTGFKSGYIGEGYANIIPAEAEAKINFRLVADQDPDKIVKRFKQFIEKETPSYVDWEFEYEDLIKAVKLDTANPKVKEIKELLKESYGEEPVIKYVGGTIPAVAFFQEIIGVEPILVSLGNDDCNMHGVNENFDIELIKKGLAFSEMFFSR